MAQGFQPLYVNGKRDKARRYYDPSTGEIIARRQYDQQYGRIRGSTNERQARENRERRERRAQRIAERRGDVWDQVRDTPMYQELMTLLGKSGKQTRYEGRRGRQRLEHQRIWERKRDIADAFGDDMTADDWQALMSPEVGGD